MRTFLNAASIHPDAASNAAPNAASLHSAILQSTRDLPQVNIMNCPASLINICASLHLATSIYILLATSLYSLLLYPLLSASSLASRSSWTSYSDRCYFDICSGTCCFSGANNNKSTDKSTDPWANVNYFYFFRFTSFGVCLEMGEKQPSQQLNQPPTQNPTVTRRRTGLGP